MDNTIQCNVELIVMEATTLHSRRPTVLIYVIRILYALVRLGFMVEHAI